MPGKMRSHQTLVFLSILLLFVLLCVCGTLPASAQALPQGPVPSRITAPVDNAARATIARSTHPMAQAQFDRGPVDPGTAMNRMILVLSASAEQEHQARAFLDSQQTKGSPDYHHWLTPEEFGQKFGPSPQDIQQVAAWLQQQGFRVGSVAKSGRWIEFSGTAEQVQAAFQTQMRKYQVAGKLHTANASDITIPAALAPVVRGVLSLHNFYSKPMHKMYRPDANVPFGGAQTHALGPVDFAKIYDLNPLYTATPHLNGAGETIAIVAASNINTVATTGVDDVATFRSVFGLPASVPNIILNGPDPGVDTVSGLGVEATLDTEWSGAVAPGATIDVVVSGGTLTTDPIALGSALIVDQDLAPIMSVSFGFCESQLGIAGNFFWANVWQQAAAEGISVFVASGDTGAAGCDAAGEAATGATLGVAVSGFASTPFNTAVGGTEFNETVNGGLDQTFWDETFNELSSVKGYIPEMAWNDSCTPTTPNTVCPQLPPANGQFLLLAGGGGLSGGGLRAPVYLTPSYQTLSITGLSFAVLKGARGIPDVSLDAAVQHDPYILCFTSDPANPDCQVSGGVVTANSFQNLAGGTSFSSPAFAGIMAIVDQKMAIVNPNFSRQGLANYVLYQLAVTGNLSGCNSNNRGDPTKTTTCVFNDTTVGNNGVPGNDVTNNPTPGALGFPTATGYDLATGLGSVDALNLVTAWGNVTFQGSQTALSSSPSSINITHGQSVQFTVTVTKSGGGSGPTGNVAVVTNQAAPQGGAFTVGAGTLSSGSFSGTTNNLPGGSYNVTANYPGDGTFAGSSSNAIPATVAAENTTTVLQSFVLNLNSGSFTPGATSVVYGDPVNILFLDADTAGVSGLFPASGKVTFTIGSNTLAPLAIDNSGIGEFIDCIFPLTTCLTPGTYAVSASYSGDGLSYNGSSSTASLTITVLKGTPTASVGGPATVNSGQQFTLTSQVQPTGAATIIPTGTVQFLDGATALGSAATLSGGVASAQVTLSSGGAHSITANYSGDTNYNAATSAATVVTVTAPFNFSATASSQTIAAGATATYNVTLNGVGGFAGAVSFACAGAPGGSTCAVSPNPANLTSTTTSVPLTVTVSNTANARLAPARFKTLPFVFAVAFAGLVWGVRRKPRHALFVVLALALIVGVGSCGGGGGTPVVIIKQPTLATLTVTGTSGSATNTITLTLTVTH
jgi:hypothetical protein